MSENVVNLLVCKPVSQLDEKKANNTKSIKVACEFCAQVVWVVPDNLIIKEKKGAKIICIPCAKRHTQEQLAKGEEVVELPARITARKLHKENA